MVKCKYVGLVTVEMNSEANPQNSKEFEEVAERFKREFGDVIKEGIKLECAGIKTSVTVEKQFADMYMVEE